MRRFLITTLLALGLCAPVQAAGLVEIALAGSVFSYSDVAFVGATTIDPQAALDAYIESLSPTLWIESRKETSYADTDAVPTATDWSGNGNDATQGTASAQPAYVASGLGGLPSYYFDGSTDFMTGSTAITYGSSLTMVVVCSLETTSTYPRAFYFGNSLSYQEIAIATDSGAVNWGVGNFAAPSATQGDRYTSTPAEGTGETVLTLLYTHLATPVLYVNGAATTYTTAVGNWSTTAINGGADNFTFGIGSAASNYFKGTISVCLGFNYQLSTEQWQTLENLLGAVYNITITH